MEETTKRNSPVVQRRLPTGAQDNILPHKISGYFFGCGCGRGSLLGGTMFFSRI